MGLMSIVTTPDVTDNELDVEVTAALETGVSKKIETMDDALRYAYGLSETRKEIEEINRLADAEVSKWQGKIDAVNDWRDSSLKSLLDKVAYMEGLLLSFHISEYYAAPNEKAQKKLNSIKLPYDVVLKSSQPQVGFKVQDDAAYKAFMEENGFVEPQEPKLKWGDFKKTLKVNEEGVVVTADGEVVDFLKAVQEDRKFEVK
jgi:hypothetical protein